jgi:hypothetical protein
VARENCRHGSQIFIYKNETHTLENKGKLPNRNRVHGAPPKYSGAPRLKKVGRRWCTAVASGKIIDRPGAKKKIPLENRVGNIQRPICLSTGIYGDNTQIQRHADHKPLKPPARIHEAPIYHVFPRRSARSRRRWWLWWARR